jgi:hypothetical protein
VWIVSDWAERKYPNRGEEMVNKAKKKRRMRKVVMRRQRQTEKEVLSNAWRNIWIKAGVLNGQ